MKDIVDKVDRLKDLVAGRHGEGKRYDRTIEEEQISLEFFGEVVANSRRIAVAMERIADLLEVTNAEDGKVITLPQILLRIAKNSEPVELLQVVNEVKSFDLPSSLWNQVEDLAFRAGQAFTRGQAAG